ncbi:hypothetical protein DFH09DRAFT_1310590 [Mycena vulgaris]|nr:hypothetical protein DFH09DRAFT_1310590 [Mycena vulgaris]
MRQLDLCAGIATVLDPRPLRSGIGVIRGGDGLADVGRDGMRVPGEGVRVPLWCWASAKQLVWSVMGCGWSAFAAKGCGLYAWVVREAVVALHIPVGDDGMRGDDGAARIRRGAGRMPRVREGAPRAAPSPSLVDENTRGLTRGSSTCISRPTHSSDIHTDNRPRSLYYPHTVHSPVALHAGEERRWKCGRLLHLDLRLPLLHQTASRRASRFPKVPSDKQRVDGVLHPPPPRGL